MLGSWYSFGYEGFPKEDRRRFLRQRDDPCDSDEERGGIGTYDDGLRCFRTAPRRRKVRRTVPRLSSDLGGSDAVVHEGESPAVGGRTRESRGSHFAVEAVTSASDTDDCDTDDCDEVDTDVLNFSDEDESDGGGGSDRVPGEGSPASAEQHVRRGKKRSRSKCQADTSAMLVERAVLCGGSAAGPSGRYSSPLFGTPLPPMCAHSLVALEWGHSSTTVCGDASADREQRGGVGSGEVGGIVPMTAAWVHGGLQPDPRSSIGGGGGGRSRTNSHEWIVSSRSFLLGSFVDRDGGAAMELSHISATNASLQVPLSLKRWVAGAVDQRGMEVFGHSSAAVPASCLPFSYDSLRVEWERECTRQRVLLQSRHPARRSCDVSLQREGRDARSETETVRLRELRCAVVLTVGGCTTVPSSAALCCSSTGSRAGVLSARHLSLPSSAALFEPRLTLVMVAVEDGVEGGGLTSPQSPRGSGGCVSGGVWRWSVTQPLVVTSESSVAPRAFATLTRLREESSVASFLLFGGTTNGSSPCEGASVPLLLTVDVAERTVLTDPLSTLGIPPEGRYAHSLTSMRGGQLLVLHGGIGRDRRMLSDTFVLDRVTRVWTEVLMPIPLMPLCGVGGGASACGRAFHAAVSVDDGNGILFLGGDGDAADQGHDGILRGSRAVPPSSSTLGPPTLQWTCTQKQDFCRGEWRRVVFPLLRSTLATTAADALLSQVPPHSPDSVASLRGPCAGGETSSPFGIHGARSCRGGSSAAVADERFQDVLHVLLEESHSGRHGRHSPSHLVQPGGCGSGGGGVGRGDVVHVFSALCHGVGCAGITWDDGSALVIGGVPNGIPRPLPRSAVSFLPCRRGTLREQLAMWLLKGALTTRVTETSSCEFNREEARREACARRAEAESTVRRDFR